MKAGADTDADDDEDADPGAVADVPFCCVLGRLLYCLGKCTRVVHMLVRCSRENMRNAYTIWRTHEQTQIHFKDVCEGILTVYEEFRGAMTLVHLWHH